MKTQHALLILAVVVAGLSLPSCHSLERLNSYGVGYQSVRLKNPPTEQAQKEARIAVAYTIDADGKLIVLVRNLTNEVVTIDQTRSFFIAPNGKSMSYYDPKIYTSSVTNYGSETSSGAFNLGGLGNALGIGGPVGSLLDATTLGASSTTGQANTNTTQSFDLPQVSIGPRGQAYMSKVFEVEGIGERAIRYAGNGQIQANTYDKSPVRFSICIYYSFDNGATYEKLLSEMYLSTQIKEAVMSYGQINNSIRKILTAKPDAVNESWWTIVAPNSYPGAGDKYSQGMIVDYR